jgi:hypothetical protein
MLSSFPLSYGPLFERRLLSQYSRPCRGMLVLLKNGSIVIEHAQMLSLIYSNEFHQILHNSTGQTVKLKIEDRHFSILLKSRNLRINQVKLVLILQ